MGARPARVGNRANKGVAKDHFRDMEKKAAFLQRCRKKKK
jgi:hypothetical protein